MSASAVSSRAHANGDGLLGAGIGAAIGHNVHGHDGALVGGAVGAIAGASLATQSLSYYDGGYYVARPIVYTPAPTHYAAAPAYTQAVPVYDAQPWVQYASRTNYVHGYSRRNDDHSRYHAHGHPDWHDNAGLRGH
jgi:hypothetical protein